MVDFDGDAIISKEEVLQAIQKDLGSKTFQLKEYTVRPASDEILGFMGEHVRIKATVVVSGVEKQVSYFGKKIPSKIKSHGDYATGTRCFYKEIEMYKTLFDDIKNASSSSKRSWRPQCFFTRDWDLVVVEDLSVEGFYMYPERTLMEYDYLRLSLKAMARMHAGSLIFEEKVNAGKAKTHSTKYTPGAGKQVIGELYPHLVYESECTNEPGHPGFKFYEVGFDSQLATVDLLDGYTQEQKEKIKKTFPDTVRQVYEMVLPSKKFKNVMIHADLWGNNLLFRNGADGKPEEVVIVDFQMTRYAPPAQDIFMLLYICQDDAFRQQHELPLLDYYYECLSKELADEGLDLEGVLPRSEFRESCDHYRNYGVLNQIIYTQLNLTPADICKKFMATPELYDQVMLEDRSELLVECFLNDELCRTRTIEAMNNVIKVFHLV